MDHEQAGCEVRFTQIPIFITIPAIHVVAGLPTGALCTPLNQEVIP